METDSSAVRIAVLIDADNTSPKYAEAILDELAKYGTPTIKRAYGDFSSTRLQGWRRELNARAIRAMHQTAFTTGKNSTDSALIIDAMDLLYAGNVEAFAIVSSDSDFTSLAMRLRESGKTVYGLGQQKTPSSLQNACDRFIMLEVLGTDSEDDGGRRGGRRGRAREPAEREADDERGADAAAQPAERADQGGQRHGRRRRLDHAGRHRQPPRAQPPVLGPAHLRPRQAQLAGGDQPYLETRTAGNHVEVTLKARRTRKATPPRRPRRSPEPAAQSRGR